VRPSRRYLIDRNTQLHARVERLIAERDTALDNHRAAAAAARRVAAELSRMKDVVALHIVAAGHPSTVLHDPKRIGEALREELAANGVDLRLELARLEGVEL
jgi:hypothetical protein